MAFLSRLHSGNGTHTTDQLSGKVPSVMGSSKHEFNMGGCFPFFQAPKQKKQLLESKYLLQKSLENYVKLNIIEK